MEAKEGAEAWPESGFLLDDGSVREPTHRTPLQTAATPGLLGCAESAQIKDIFD